MESQHGLKITLIILKIFSNAFSRGYNRLFKKNLFKTYNDGIIQGLEREGGERDRERKEIDHTEIKDIRNLFRLKKRE